MVAAPRALLSPRRRVLALRAHPPQAQSYYEEEESDAEELESVEGKNWDDWLRTSEFYVFGAVYMCARIAMNVAAVFIPLYVATVTARPTAEGEESAETNFQVATVPLVAYTSSLLWSLLG